MTASAVIRPEVIEHRFAAMGTRVYVLVHGGPRDIVDAAVRRIDELEDLWSRFRPDSDISKLNVAGGRPLEVDDATYLLVQRACQAWHLSDGVFDPTVHQAMVANGYDRSFDDLGRPAGVSSSRAAAGAAPGCASIELDDRARTVKFPAEVTFDPGGIGKGLAADLVAGQIMRAGAQGCLVSIGGDLVARGTAPDDHAWTVTIDEPAVGIAGPIATVSFEDGALATSTTARRTWIHNGTEQHHLVSSGSGTPMRSGIVLATALACEGWLAEITTKALIANRVSPALASVPALTFDHTGTLRASAGMEDYLS